ncbi:hypothetical protein B0H15DRAFT_927599 [Mycena belliarum]|uniref:Uncharacterized protein n=1 Tax=Mycena belliarum TaxID=1033014 RepID=A0AAD6XVZ7_9AGAR|nr:hypothetical protein B0H15DRAFT_927599 [Mycena belliae]
MSSEYGQFISQLFDHIFFGNDKAAGLAAFERDIAPDAKIAFNGAEIDNVKFREELERFHGNAIAEPISKETLAMVELPGGGAVCSGVVKLKRTDKMDGSVKNQVAVQIIKVETRGGRKVVTAWCGVRQ